MIKRQLYTFLAILGFFLWVLLAPSYLWEIFATLVVEATAGVLLVVFGCLIIKEVLNL